MAWIRRGGGGGGGEVNQATVRAALAAATGAVAINEQDLENVGALNGVDVNDAFAHLANLPDAALGGVAINGGDPVPLRAILDLIGSGALDVSHSDTPGRIETTLHVDPVDFAAVNAALATADAPVALNSQRLADALGMLLKTEAVPAAPSGSDLLLTNSPWAGRNTLIQSIAALQRPMIPHFGRKVVGWLPNFTAGAGTGGIARGISVTNTGTVSHPTPSNADFRQSLHRTRVVAADTNQNTFARLFTSGSESPFWRGNAAGLGGFCLCWRFAQNTNTNGDAAFVGLRAGGNSNGSPSAVNNHIGLSYDAADANTGNWFLSRRDGSTTTRVDLGAGLARNVNDVIELWLYCEPNGSFIGVRVANLTAETTVLEGTYTADLPINSVFFLPEMMVQNGTGGVAGAIELISLEAIVGA